MNRDHLPYCKSTGPAVLDKAINSLLGLIEGVCIDGVVNQAEIHFMRAWLLENAALRRSHPFSELVPVVERALADGVVADDERRDIAWLCERLRSDAYVDTVIADMQRLHAIVAAITADQDISRAELLGLSDWLAQHPHLKTCWPYEEIGSVITAVLADGKIDSDEHLQLQRFFAEFVVLADNKTVVNPLITEGASIVGLCAVCPDLSFAGKRFCFTGASDKYTRAAFNDLVQSLGGAVSANVSAKVDYVVIGADGNPCWAYACYGRKVEMAVKLRKQGHKLLLVHEYDFHDAVTDCGHFTQRITQGSTD